MMGSSRVAFVYVASMWGMAALATACSGAAENDPPPQPKTVAVTVEKTVERTVEATTPSSDGEETTSDSGNLTCEVGNECDLGESSITVTGTSQAQTINTSFGETFEGDFVVVEFDYTYGGSVPSDLDEPPFLLRDKNGNSYSLNFEATNAYGIDKDRSLIYETVQPGVAAPGTAIFEVSPDAEDFTLILQDLVSPQTSETAEVPIPEEGQLGVVSSGDEPDEPTATDPSLDSFISTYYEAVGREDWVTTYSLLDSESQAVFTEEEWIQKQTARSASSPTPPVTGAVVNSTNVEGSDQFVNVTLTYEDGGQEALDIVVRSEGEQYRRHLTDDEVAFLAGF